MSAHRSWLWMVLLPLAVLPGHALSQAASASPAASAPTPTVAGTALATVPAGPYALTRNGGKGWAVRVPIVVAEGKAPVATLLDVIFKDGRSAALIESFKLRLTPAANERGAALELDTGDKDLLPGSYLLSLKLSDLAAKSTPQTVQLNLSVGSPQVSVMAGKVVVSQVREMRGNIVATAGTMKVSWGNGPAPMLLTPVEAHEPPAKGDAETAELAFAPQAETAADSTLNYHVSPRGEFPLGTTIGRIELRSPSLATPVSIPYEVRARRSYAWISWLAAVGALTGWALRTQIPKQRSLLLARAAMAAARRSVLRALQDVDDADFIDKMNAINRALDRADENRDAALLAAEAKTAEDAVRTALAAIEALVPPLRQRIETLHELVNTDWQLPTDVKAELLDLPASVERAAQQLNRRNVGACARLVEKLERVGLTRLRRDADGYVAALLALLNRAGAQPFPMGEHLARHLALIKADAGSYTTPSTDAASTLSQLQDIFRKVQSFAATAHTKTDAWCTQVANQLGDAFGGAPAGFAALQAQCTQAADSFAADLQNPVPSTWPAATASPLVPTWKAFLLALAPTVDAAALEQELKQGHWHEAVVLTITAAPVQVSSMAAAAGPQGARRRVTMAVPVDEAMPAAVAVNTAVRGVLAAQSAAPTLASLGNERDALLSDEHRLAFIQSLGFAAFFVAGVHLLYAENWIGSYKEFATLFILAFGVDLTSDSVMAALRSAATTWCVG